MPTFCSFKIFLDSSNMEVAIKATRNMQDATPDVARDRILQEGRLFWLLKHENIISLHGICLEEPNMCLIMEYARGGPLNRILGNGRRIRPDVLVDWAIQVKFISLKTCSKSDTCFLSSHIFSCLNCSAFE